MEFNILMIGAGVAAVLVALLAVWRTGSGSVVDSLTGIQKAIETAKGYVLAAEQLWVNGKLPKDDRAAWVLEQLREELPGLDESTLIIAIEGAVAWMKLLARRGE